MIPLCDEGKERRKKKETTISLNLSSGRKDDETNLAMSVMSGTTEGVVDALLAFMDNKRNR